MKNLPAGRQVKKLAAKELQLYLKRPNDPMTF